MKHSNSFLPKTTFLAIWLAALICALNVHAQKYTVLHTFAGAPADGSVPIGRLLLSGNILYGTASGGGVGTNTTGTVFSIHTDGTGYTNLYSFSPNSGYYNGSTNYYYNWDGETPNGGLQLSGNTLYGVTEGGGLPDGWGTLFSINTDGTGFNIVHNFAQSDGGIAGRGDNNPWSDVLLSGDTLYGTTLNGVVYSVNTNGTNFSLLARTGENDGAGENDYGLIMSGNTLYGVTELGGTNGLGNVFSVNAAGGGFQDLHDFGPNNQSGNSSGGTDPATRLVLAGDKLYGATLQGGTNGATLFSMNTDGSDFTILYNFGGADGNTPGWGLVSAGDTLYGVCMDGGRYGGGTIFSINTNGAGFTVLYSFTGGSDGGWPWGGLTLSGCTLYGTCSGSNGDSSSGTVYRFAIVPRISSWNLTATNVVLNLTNGVANCAYTVLMSTNLALPMSQWTPLTTNIPTASGNFTITATNTVNSAVTEQFWTLKAQ